MLTSGPTTRNSFPQKCGLRWSRFPRARNTIRTWCPIFLTGKSTISDLLLPCECQLVLHFVGATGAVGFADVFQGDLIELLAVRRRVAARDAGLAKLRSRLVDGPRDGFNR